MDVGLMQWYAVVFVWEAGVDLLREAGRGSEVCHKLAQDRMFERALKECGLRPRPSEAELDLWNRGGWWFGMGREDNGTSLGSACGPFVARRCRVMIS